MQEVIVSKDNKYYKLLKKLNEKKYRDENNIFLAEGEKFLNENINFQKIIIKEENFEYFNKKYNISNYSNVTILSNKLFNSISSQETSQGIIFIYNKAINQIENIKGDVVIVDDVQDPGNIGSMIRSIVALGYKNLILTHGSVDVYSPKVVRATMGAIFRLNIIYEKKEKILDFLRKNKYQIIVTALHKDSINFNEIKLIDNNAYIFGHEGGGVSEFFIKNSDIKSIIPMFGNMESFNVAVALGIFLYKMREK